MGNNERPRAIFLTHGYRSGSNFVASVMANNGLGNPAEYFGRTWESQCMPLHLEDRIANVQQIVSTQAVDGIFAVKMPLQDMMCLLKATKISYFNADRLSKYFSKSIFVHLFRRDTFAQAVSYWRASKSGEWFAYKKDPKSSVAPDFDFEGIYSFYLDLCRKRDIWNCFFEKNKISPITSAYEEFSENENGLSRLIQQVGKELSPTFFADKALTLVSDNRIQRDDTSREYRDRFVFELMDHFTSAHALGSDH